MIRDGWSTKSTTVHFKNNAGYNARLFLGDFNKVHIPDIMVSIDTGESGGYGIFYIYSFENNMLSELFNFDKYNEEYTFQLNYADFYKVRVESHSPNRLFILDISTKGSDYLSEYYDAKGLLKNPLIGGVLALGTVNPIITTNKSYNYDLVALQRIIGPTNVDTLGYVENLLSWKDTQFQSNRLSVSVPFE